MLVDEFRVRPWDVDSFPPPVTRVDPVVMSRVRAGRGVPAGKEDDVIAKLVSVASYGPVSLGAPRGIGDAPSGSSGAANKVRRTRQSG